MPVNNEILSVNGARIGESTWNFPVGSSILFRGDYQVQSYATGCESFVDANGQPITPQFHFENLDGDDVHPIRGDTSISLHLSGNVHFSISNVGEVDIIGVNCNSGF